MCAVIVIAGGRAFVTFVFLWKREIQSSHTGTTLNTATGQSLSQKKGSGFYSPN